MKWVSVSRTFRNIVCRCNPSRRRVLPATGDCDHQPGVTRRSGSRLVLGGELPDPERRQESSVKDAIHRARYSKQVDRFRMGDAGRCLVEREFSLEKVIEQAMVLYLDMRHE